MKKRKIAYQPANDVQQGIIVPMAYVTLAGRSVWVDKLAQYRVVLSIVVAAALVGGLILAYGTKLSSKTGTVVSAVPFYDITLPIRSEDLDAASQKQNNIESDKEAGDKQTAAFSVAVVPENIIESEQSDGVDTAAYITHAVEEVAQGQTIQAVEDLRNAVRAEPNNMRYRLDLAVLYDRIGDNKNALILYRQIADTAQAGDPLIKSEMPVIKTRMDYLASIADR